MSNIKSNIINYWNKRSQSFVQHKKEELHSEQAQLWVNEIERYVHLDSIQTILDIGTGAGFLAILCSKYDCDVTGIDISPEMIHQAQNLSQELNVHIQFKVMDAEDLNFADDSFDLVIARNVTWLMTNPFKAYEEWLRVLKPHGHLLNFDADYGKDNFTQISDLSNSHAHNDLEFSMLKESEHLKNAIDINQHTRPTYDCQILEKCNVSKIEVDPSVYQRVNRPQSQFYNPSPLFGIHVVK